jgi:hypothetical protein
MKKEASAVYNPIKAPRSSSSEGTMREHHSRRERWEAGAGLGLGCCANKLFLAWDSHLHFQSLTPWMCIMDHGRELCHVSNFSPPVKYTYNSQYTTPTWSKTDNIHTRKTYYSQVRKRWVRVEAIANEFHEKPILLQMCGKYFLIFNQFWFTSEKVMQMNFSMIGLK